MMRITKQAWNNYVNKLSKIDHTASVVMQRWIDSNKGASLGSIISAAFLLTGKYGEAAATLACEMYDELAIAQGKIIQPAVPADPPGENYVKSAVSGTIQDKGLGSIPDLVSRMVKQTGADTTLKNAKRDGAYFAWIPGGDSCAFCLTLASRGWQKASKKTIKGNHAEHIHNHCKCEFAISFDGPGTVEGYDPGKYKDMYDNAEGAIWKDKVNSIRRDLYAEQFRRRIGEEGQEIIDKPTYNKLTRAFIKHGGIVIRGNDADKHLKGLGAYASYLPSFNTAFIRDDATVSDVIEEMYHAEQDRINKYGEKLTEEVLLRREIDAQKHLISVSKKYKIPIEEMEVTQKNLETYEKQLRGLLSSRK